MYNRKTTCAPPPPPLPFMIQKTGLMNLDGHLYINFYVSFVPLLFIINYDLLLAALIHKKTHLHVAPQECLLTFGAQSSLRVIFTACGL